MRRVLHDGYELDDAPERLDIEAIHAAVIAARWSRDRSFDQMETAINTSTRAVGLYLDDVQVGFGRAVSDGMVAYLADVYVLQAHRGKGLGLELTRELLERGDGAQLRWLLHTADAGGLYKKLGFTELLRPRRRMWHFVYAPPMYPVMERGPQDT